MQTLKQCTTVLPLAVLLPISASAHHAFGGVFDMRNLIEIEGEITDVRWQNPHVRFSVQTNDGAVWDVETNSVSIIRRMDVSADLLNVGDRLRVAGYPSRRGDTAMWTNNVLLEDGRELVLRPGFEPHWGDSALGSSETWLAEGSDARGTAAEARGIFRVWSTHFERNFRGGEGLFTGVYPLTAAAQELRDAYDPVADNPIRGCDPKGMPWIMSQPYPIELVQAGDNIEYRTEEYDLVRTFYMGDDATTDGPPSLLGHSVGRWEGDELVVETRNISWRFFDGTGVQHSEALELVERFGLNADGSRLLYTLTATDPATFTEPVVLDKDWVWRPGEVVRPFQCVPDD